MNTKSYIYFVRIQKIAKLYFDLLMVSFRSNLNQKTGRLLLLTGSFFILLTIPLKINAKSSDEFILQLSCKLDTLKQNQPDSIKLKINQECISLFSKILALPESFDNPYKELPNIGKVLSDDGKVKIYTWGFPLQDKSFAFAGFIQKKEKKMVITTPLKIRETPYVPMQNKNIPPTNWYGALYYKVVKIKQRKEEYYLALGWSGNDASTDFKVIEPIFFDRNGRVSYFGKPLFETENKKFSRIVLEYTSEGKVTLNMNDTNTMIIFDHLIPIEPMYQGIKAYYGPDFTYDAYQIEKKGGWRFEENIDARNK